MVRRQTLNLLTLVLLPASCAVLLLGCGAGRPELGPKPASYVQDPYQSEMVDNLRTWLEKLGPRETKTLQRSGEVTFSYEELKSSDPAHARIIDQYVVNMETNMEQQMRATGVPVGQLELTPDDVSFTVQRDSEGKPVRGAYGFRIRFQAGNLAQFQLSDPL